jgi:signal transduction histidine kinase
MIDALDVSTTVREIASLIMAELAREHVLLEMDMPPGLPPARGDRVQVQQVMMNLVRNAIEAMRAVTHRRVLILSASYANDMVTLRVADTGPGIEPSKIETLFEPLYTTKADGMGLGLAISRKIAAAHGGRLWAEAKDGPGATFCVSLPAAGAPDADAWRTAQSVE